MSADPRWRLSGGASNSVPALSIGGVMSSTEIAPGDNNLFDDVSGQETADGHTDYRGVYVYNNGDVDLIAPVVWVQDETVAAADIQVAPANEAVGATMATIAGELVAPSSVTFVDAPNKASGIVLPNIPASSRKGIWIKRTVLPGTSAAAARTFNIRVEGDTT